MISMEGPGEFLKRGELVKRDELVKLGEFHIN